MNWKCKAHLMALVSRAPVGKLIYRRAQRFVGTNRLNVTEEVSRCIEIVQLIRNAGRLLCSSIILEIGTGWRPFMSFVLHLAGAERVITLDVNPWLTRRYAFETAHALAGQIGRIANELELEEAFVRQRYLAATKGKETLAGLLSGFHVEYQCPADARDTQLPEAALDFVCSSNVLEHVPPNVLEGIHRESIRVLRPGGLAVHRFNPQDHFAFTDRSITGANFLRYSKKQWYWLGGSGLSYHNRLRCAEHLRLFEAAGFETVVNRVRVDERVVAALNSGALDVHPDFAGYSPQELAADYMWYVGRRPGE